jgi:hypothetical protein
MASRAGLSDILIFHSNQDEQLSSSPPSSPQRISSVGSFEEKYFGKCAYVPKHEIIVYYWTNYSSGEMLNFTFDVRAETISEVKTKVVSLIGAKMLERNIMPISAD